MKGQLQKFAYSAIATCAVLALPVATAVAGSRIYDNSVSTCTTENCSSIYIPGTVTNPGGNNDPFTLQVFATAGQCVRIAVVYVPGGADLETTVVAPNGSVYRNDDSTQGGVFTRRPLVKIGSAPNTGWYNVTINHYAGTPTYADFAMYYGRYPAGNANCATPTTPFAPASAADGAPKVDTGAVQQPGTGTLAR